MFVVEKDDYDIVMIIFYRRGFIVFMSRGKRFEFHPKVTLVFPRVQPKK